MWPRLHEYVVIFDIRNHNNYIHNVKQGSGDSTQTHSGRVAAMDEQLHIMHGHQTVPPPIIQIRLHENTVYYHNLCWNNVNHTL